MAGILPYSLTNRSPLFNKSVDKLFNNWTALDIAVQNGQGGAYGKEIALWMRGAVETFFYENNDLGGVEVSEFLGTMMDQELDTIVDDNSLEELGEALCQHFRLAMSNNEAELLKLHLSLEAASLRAKPQVKVQTADGGGDDESSGSSSDEEMETDEANGGSNGNGMKAPTDQQGPSSSSQPQPQHHRAGQNFVTEPDDDGWVTVIKNKK